ncbi:hypothetical protein ElyMa_004793500 [Elysia marginata]|uniref:Uncharacterized protein n=1 Tax=Elysia marginata TaxID=1093978 RepID=A0AAV4IEF7_9GAST|nr:hypothetical protein ElyMa_004793500 [Elysia marginata]
MTKMTTKLTAPVDFPTVHPFGKSRRYRLRSDTPEQTRSHYRALSRPVLVNCGVHSGSSIGLVGSNRQALPKNSCEVRTSDTTISSVTLVSSGPRCRLRRRYCFQLEVWAEQTPLKQKQTSEDSRMRLSPSPTKPCSFHSRRSCLMFQRLLSPILDTTALFSTDILATKQAGTTLRASWCKTSTKIPCQIEAFPFSGSAKRFQGEAIRCEKKKKEKIYKSRLSFIIQKKKLVCRGRRGRIGNQRMG